MPEYLTAAGILSHRGFSVTGPLCVSSWISVVNIADIVATSVAVDIGGHETSSW
jgi:hypothetical protein